MSDMYIANDGTVCESVEELAALNKKIKRMLLPDVIDHLFGLYQSHEQVVWFRKNVARRGE